MWTKSKRIVSHYHLLNVIGEGATGKVYLARDTLLQRLVALKTLHEDLCNNPAAVARIRREAELLSRVSSTHIPIVYGLEQEGGLHFIVTEFIEGETVRALLKAPINVLLALDIAIQSAAALEAAHAQGVFHCDVKPENIMRRTDGIVKVIDFSVVALDEDGISTAGLDQSQMDGAPRPPRNVYGTVPYMSPEQLRREVLDGRTDVFSLGIVLYEMISGARPFAGKGSKAINSIISEEPLCLSERCPGIPSEIDQVVLKALMKKRTERFASMREFRQKLEEVKATIAMREVEAAEALREVEAAETPIPLKGVVVPPSNGQPNPYWRPFLAAGRRPFLVAVRGLRSLSTIAIISISVCVGLVAGGISLIHFPPATTPAEEDRGGTSRISPLGPTAPKDKRGDPKAIAVLPFSYSSPERGFEYVANGITESLIDALSESRRIRVKAMSEVSRYKGKSVSAQVVSGELGVDAVIEGKVLVQDSKITIKTQVVEREGFQAWNRRYDGDLSEILEIQKKIARDIAQYLRMELGPDAGGDFKSYTREGRAYLQYLHGRFHFASRTGPDLKEAALYYRKALEIDDKFGQAYAGLASCYVLLGSMGYSELPPAEAMSMAREAALSAIELRDDLAEGHTALALVKLLYDWDFVGAETKFKDAISRDRYFAPAHHWYANYLIAMGRMNDALEEIRQAKELDPDSDIIKATVGWTRYFSRDFDGALREYEEALKSNPNFYPTLALSGFAFEARGEAADAVERLSRAREISGGSAVMIAELGRAFALSGDIEKARRSLAELTSVSRLHYVPPYCVAMVYVGLGDRDRAFEWLEKAYSERSGWLIYLRVEPLLDPLRSDPRFRDLVHRVGLP